MLPRPLHYQVAASREILVYEQMDMHLVWGSNRIYLKPIPGYLLDYSFWNDLLVCKSNARCECFKHQGSTPSTQTASIQPSLQIQNQSQRQRCTRRHLYGIALGFLLSYAALIQYESDFRIAQSAYLMPQNVDWKSWRELVKQISEPKNVGNIDKRFRFGELRLSRLNTIYRFRLGTLRGYKFGLQNYGEYFRQNLAPIVSLIAYIAIVLTAMQVGLATDRLGQNDIFQRASFGFTVFSIFAPLILLTMVGLGFLVLFLSNFIATMSYEKKRFAMYDHM